MFPLGSRSLRIGVVGAGETLSETLAARADDVEPGLDVEPVPGESIGERDPESGYDCFVIDGRAADRTGVELVANQ